MPLQQTSHGSLTDCLKLYVHTLNDQEYELQRNINPKSTFRELLLVGYSEPHYRRRKAGFDGMGIEFVDNDGNNEAVDGMQKSNAMVD